METDGVGAFGNLPDVMVEELLKRATDVSDTLSGRVAGLSERRDGMRERALAEGVIRQLPGDVEDAEDKTVVGIDGSRASERMAGVELYVAAAIRVLGYGGLNEPAPPDFKLKECLVAPLSEGERLIRTLMGFLEAELLIESDHDLVLVDGAFSTIVVNACVGVDMAATRWDKLSVSVMNRWENCVRDGLPELLDSGRVVAIPKRSTVANEFANYTRLFDGFSDTESDRWSGRFTAESILKGGEYSKPMPFLTMGRRSSGQLLPAGYKLDLDCLLDSVKVVYFRAHDWSPVYRVEVPSAGLSDLELKLELIRRQCVNPAMREPYPLYLADRFVRSLGLGVSAILDSVRRDVAAGSSDMDLVMSYLGRTRTDAPQLDEDED